MSEADKIIKNLKNSGKKVEEFYVSNKTSDKNVANIEDDVKLVKRYLENSAYKESDSDFFKNGGWEMVDLEIPKAMANILAEREQKDKQIKELEEENHIQRKQLNDAFEKGFIHKDKVKEALEDIEDYFDRLNGPDEDIEYIRQVKKELLEGGRK